MTPEELAQRLETLDHHERIAELVAHARAVDEVEAVALVRSLLQGDAHHRWLGLNVALARRDAALAAGCVADPSLMVRSLAARVVARHAQTVDPAMVDELDAHTLRVVLFEIDRAGRVDLAESFADALVARDRLAEASRLLGRVSDAWLSAHLALAWPETAWLRLAKRRPQVVLERVRADLARAERADVVWRSLPAAFWWCLAERAPTEVAELVELHADDDTLPAGLAGHGLAHLARRVPGKVVGWLGARIAWTAQHGVPAALSDRVRGVPDEVLAPLLRGLATARPELCVVLLRRLPAPRRGRLFQLAVSGLATERTEWPEALLQLLPDDLRDAEAARMLGLARAATDGTWRRMLLGLRDVAVARAPIELEARGAQAEARGEALGALILATARSRGGMAETLAFAQRIKNEQDPVRLAALGALARVPGHRFDDPAALEAVVAPIFDARDTSWATRQAAARIGHALLIANATKPRSPMFACGLALLEKLAGHAGTPDIPRLDRNLPRGAEVAIVDALLPWLEAARSRQQAHHVFRVRTALGKRGRGLAKLDALIADVLWNGHKNHASPAATQWLEDPKTRDRRVREMVKRDASAIYLHEATRHAHRRRQTLLVGRFAVTAPRGRFHDGKVAWVPAFAGGFHRWSTPVQAAYLAMLRAAERDPKHFTQSRAALIAMRAPIPLTTLADLQSPLRSTDVPVLEAALAACAHLDAPAAALPVLLGSLDGDRARVAMYALPRLASRLPREGFVASLADVLAREGIKVTVHKEAVRLLGWARTPRAVALLEAQWSGELHRDVRIAALHAARSALAVPAAWDLVEAAATHPSPDVARGVVEVAFTAIAAPHRARYLAIMARVADHPSPEARSALFTSLAAGWALADLDLAVRLAARVLHRGDLTDPASAACALLADGARGASLHDATFGVVAHLADATDTDVTPAGERDRLAHRRLRGVVDVLVRERHPVARVLVDRVGRSLVARAPLFGEGARLCLAAASCDGFARVVVELLASAPSTRASVAVEGAARAAAAASIAEWTAEQAAASVAELAAGAPASRSVAAGLLAVFGPRWGWGEEWTVILAALRADPDLDVRTRARAVWITPS